MTHRSADPITPDPTELAEAYVVGALSSDERTEFESRVIAGDEACRAALQAYQVVADELANSIEPVQPSAGVRDALRARLKSDEQDGGKADAPPFAALDGGEADPISQDRNRWVILRRDEMDWQESGVEGVRLRNLFVDEQANRLTVLIKMDPGAHYPNHDHPEAEECMVIEGDLHIADTVLRQFDYLRTPKGGDHGEPWTENGCLLLVTTPLAA